MTSGDTLLLYTDGITEMMNRNREEFGFERLVKTFTKHSKLPLQECMNTVIDDVITFGNDKVKNENKFSKSFKVY